MGDLVQAVLEWLGGAWQARHEGGPAWGRFLFLSAALALLVLLLWWLFP